MSENRISVFQINNLRYYYEQPVFNVPGDQTEFFGEDMSRVKAVLMPEKVELEVYMYRRPANNNGVRIRFDGDNGHKYLEWLHKHLERGQSLRVEIMAENDIVLYPIGELVK